MKRKLKTIAMQLSESDIQELIQFRKMGDKRVVELRKKRDKLAADLRKLDVQIQKLTGEPAVVEAEAAEPKRRGRRPGKKKGTGRKPRAVKESAAKEPVAKKAGGRRGRKSSRSSLSAAVREVFAKAGTPLKASQVVDALSDVGIKVADVSAMRKRISVVLASQKNHFEQVERGLYQLKG